MKHHQKTKKFGRTKKKRRALMNSLTESLILNEKIKTTEAKAKALRPYAEKMITKAKDDSAHTRRQLEKKLSGRRPVVTKLVEEVGPRFKDRPGGYTRITKLPPRKSDGAFEAIIELMPEENTQEASEARDDTDESNE